jgi:hypothetical protein
MLYEFDRSDRSCLTGLIDHIDRWMDSLIGVALNLHLWCREIHAAVHLAKERARIGRQEADPVAHRRVPLAVVQQQ